MRYFFRWWKMFFVILFLGFCCLFCFNYLQEKNEKVLEDIYRENFIETMKFYNLSRIDERNNDVEVSYDFSKVKSIEGDDVIKYSSKDNLPVIGSISIPSIGMTLPIIKGVSNESMSSGAGTLKPYQKMGEGNFVLASHHMKNPKLLFSPLDKVKVGQKIILFDSQNKFEYVITKKKVVKATDVNVIDDVKGKTLVTLVTCHNQGTTRLVVIGELVKEV